MGCAARAQPLLGSRIGEPASAAAPGGEYVAPGPGRHRDQSDRKRSLESPKCGTRHAQPGPSFGRAALGRFGAGWAAAGHRPHGEPPAARPASRKTRPLTRARRADCPNF